jgi:nitrate/nitrite transporter NarK
VIRRGWNETRTRKTMLGAAFLCGVMLIPAARVASPLGALACLIGGAFVGLANGNMFAILQSCAPPNEVGTWTGFENFAGNIGGVLAPVVTGFLIARTGAYLSSFALATGILLAGIFAYGFIVGELKPVVNELQERASRQS